MSSTDVTRQKHFFDDWDQAERVPVAPRDPHVQPQDRPRLRGQNAAILKRLRRGPATNRELAAFALNYRARVSDLRAAGYVIQCDQMAGGLSWYELKERR